MAIQSVAALLYRGAPINSHYAADGFQTPGHGFYIPFNELMKSWERKDDPPPEAKPATRTAGGLLILNMVPRLPLGSDCTSCKRFMGRCPPEQRIETDVGVKFLLACPYCGKAYLPDYL